MAPASIDDTIYRLALAAFVADSHSATSSSAKATSTTPATAGPALATLDELHHLAVSANGDMRAAFSALQLWAARQSSQGTRAAPVPLERLAQEGLAMGSELQRCTAAWFPGGGPQNDVGDQSTGPGAAFASDEAMRSISGIGSFHSVGSLDNVDLDPETCGAAQRRRHSLLRRPRVQRTFPLSGFAAGGNTVTVFGSGFSRNSSLDTSSAAQEGQ